MANDKLDILSKDVLHQNIDLVNKLRRHITHSVHLINHIVDDITRFAGSLMLIVVHVLWFGAWIAWNMGLIANVKPLDPYPFGLLTVMVS